MDVPSEVRSRYVNDALGEGLTAWQGVITLLRLRPLLVVMASCVPLGIMTHMSENIMTV